MPEFRFIWSSIKYTKIEIIDCQMSSNVGPQASNEAPRNTSTE